MATLNPNPYGGVTPGGPKLLPPGYSELPPSYQTPSPAVQTPSNSIQYPGTPPQGGQQAPNPAAMAGLAGAAPGGQANPGMVPSPTSFVAGSSAVGQTNGGPQISQGAYETQQQTLLNSQLAQQAAERRLSAIQSLDKSGGSAAHVDMGGIGSDEAGARAAAFARAKEQAGQGALAGLHSVQDWTQGNGLMGSSVEGNMIGNVIGGAGGQVNDYTREQLIQDLGRAAQISDETYQGNITQRGQDLNRQQTLLGLIAGGNLY